MAGARRIPIIGLGAGTHVKSVLDAIQSAERFEAMTLVDDDPDRAGSAILGVPVVCEKDGLTRLRSDGVRHAFVGVAGTRESGPRRSVFQRLRDAAFELPEIVHRTASVSSFAHLGAGVQVLANAVVNADAVVEDGAIVNTGAIVEHDCRLGAHAHVAPGVRLAGLVKVGEGAHVGIGAIVIEGIEIGEEAFVAAGAVVVQDVPNGVRVAGVPARAMD
jgi:UDP-perosamine 4-acetyltransferase